MEDLKLLLLKHNMALHLLQTIRSYQRCAGAGLFGNLTPAEQQVVNELNTAAESIEELCMQYYDIEEVAANS